MKSIHFVGMKGVGMTPLAVIAKQAGLGVTGCDVGERYITDEILQKEGITPLVGFSKEHVADVDLVITTGAHGGFDNPEVIAAKAHGIEVWTQGEAVGKFMQGGIFNKKNIGISVTGCHGKTTTSAMIATLLQVAGKDPSWVVGTGDIPSLGASGHFGKGEYFVAEADEYASEPVYERVPKFFLQHPKIAVITNIEYDHPDLYPTFADLVKAYNTFAQQVVSEGGILIANGDDNELKKIIKNLSANIKTFGFGKNNTVILQRISEQKGKTQFTFTYAGRDYTHTLSVIGEHNVKNALAAFLVAKECGLSDADIQEGLAAFVGTKRRLELVGSTALGAMIYDDYAHHPTEIATTLSALRTHFPKEHIICAFQPHTFSRTKILFNEFSTAFSTADEVILTDIFPSAREPYDSTISSKDLALAVKKTGKPAIYLPTLLDVVKYLQERKLGKDTIVVIMGAGDVYSVAYKIKA